LFQTALRAFCAAMTKRERCASTAIIFGHVSGQSHNDRRIALGNRMLANTDRIPAGVRFAVLF
jgi:hypothetical protein